MEFKERFECEEEAVEYMYDFEQGRKKGQTFTEEEKAVYRKLVEEFASEGDILALQRIADECAGGTDVFPCDWKKAEGALLQLLENRVDDPNYATRLGRIYANGYTTDGHPDLDNAFKYFAMAAAGGDPEGRFEVGIRIANGLGVPANTTIGNRCIMSLYEDLYSHMIEGRDYLVFAKAATYLGDDEAEQAEYFQYWRHVMEENIYRYYLEAQYALKQAREEGDVNFDNSLEKEIQDRLDEYEQRLPEKYFEDKTIFLRSLVGILSPCLDAKYTLKVAYRKLKSEAYSLTFSVDENFYGQEADFFTIIPEFKYCGTSKKLKAKVFPSDEFRVPKKSGTIYFDKIDEDGNLYYRNRLCGCIKGNSFISRPE